jgi:hypothetical protein
MAGRSSSDPIVPFVSSLVVLLQNVVGTMFGPKKVRNSDDGNPTSVVEEMHEMLMNMETIVSSVLHDFRLSNAALLLGQHWVLGSTSWYCLNLPVPNV